MYFECRRKIPGQMVGLLAGFQGNLAGSEDQGVAMPQNKAAPVALAVISLPGRAALLFRGTLGAADAVEIQ
jgi:hypothetical protein